MSRQRLILENKLGQGVRAYEVETDFVSLIYRHDTRRVEVVGDLSPLRQANISFDVLKEFNPQALKKADLTLAGLGKLRLAEKDEKLNSTRHQLPPDKEDGALTGYLKKSSVGHAAAVAALVGLSLLTGYLTQKPEEPTLVTIQIPEKVQPPAPEHVKVAEHKIKPIPKIHARVVNHPVPTPKIVQHHIVKHLPTQRKSPMVVRNAPERPVGRVGALAALGGLKNGTRGAEGLDSQSMKNIRSAGVGRGGGGVGDSGSGGVRGLMPGHGLIAGSAGGGGRAESAGGYGTRGTGGGKAGYGKISLVGGTSGISLPLEDEALVEGGLDRDQIAAVINRNKGQIIYCYEQGLQNDPDLRGRVSVQFVIGAAGRITTAHVAQSSLASKSVEGCMVAKMRNWQFPQPVGKVNVDVLYPFELRRVSSR